MAMLQSHCKTNGGRKGLKPPNNMEVRYKVAYQNVLLEIIEDVISDLLFKVHRGVKLGYFPVQEHILKEKEFEVHKSSQENGSHGYLKGSDIFGHFKGTQTFLLCPRCRKKLCSSRFAPHLYNCMGFGRRLCLKRNTTKRTTSDMYESEQDDEDNSSDTNSAKKKKKVKNAKKKAKHKNSEAYVVATYEANFGRDMTLEIIQDFLSQMCGVISGHTGRFCRNTVKCSMHEDNERRNIRDILFKSRQVVQIPDDIHIDVDTVDEDNPVQLWYPNPKTSKKNNSPVENTVCLSSAGVSGNRQEDNSSSLSQLASSSHS